MTNMTYAELQAQIDQLQKQAQEALVEEKSGAIHRIKQLMEAHGVTLEDISAKLKSTKKSWSQKSSTVLYKDPESGKTWSGRGRAPLWIGDKDREQFKVSAA